MKRSHYNHVVINEKGLSRTNGGSDFNPFHILSDQPFEFPQLNYNKHNTHEYRYVYGTGERQGMPLYSLLKFDTKNGDIKSWSDDLCCMGEALFIEKPGSKNGDDGALLPIGLDAKKDKSFIIILDARTSS